MVRSSHRFLLLRTSIVRIGPSVGTPYRKRPANPICLVQRIGGPHAMKHNNTDFGISEDPEAHGKWRYTIYPKIVPGGPQITVSGYYYPSHSDAEEACKKAIDAELRGVPRAQES
jgi:hypothetical protein